MDTTPLEGPMSSPQGTDFSLELSEPRKAVTFNEEESFVRDVSSLDDRQIQLGKDPHPPKSIPHTHLPRPSWTEKGVALDLDVPSAAQEGGLFARRFAQRASENMGVSVQG
eukprot:GGOE01060726.1.p4 GENE.GGOE01060726.1~~GGOE01060726.1.p4  ORF type:complete len:119 (+),score=38.37 GGOE01060726.1:25-357(+)